MLDCGIRIKAVDAANHLVDGAETKLGHQLACFFGDHKQVIDYVFGFACKLLAQLRILRSDPHRTSVEMTLTHHDAAERDQRRGRKTKLFGAQHRGNHHVAARLQTAVSLQHHAATQVVEHQGLVRLGDTKFPRQAGVLDARERRSTRTTAISGNEDVVGKAFGHTGSDCAHANFGDELDAHACGAVGVFQIVDQLFEIFDRINIVVRWRTDQTNTRSRVTNAGNVFIDLAAG